MTKISVYVCDRCSVKSEQITNFGIAEGLHEISYPIKRSEGEGYSHELGHLCEQCTISFHNWFRELRK